jgi:hypothetical protein
LHVNWHVAPLSPPQPHRHCASCGRPRPFQPSGKVRLNANGRRLDAWLIYKCTVCDRTWNLPLLDRVPVAEVPPGDLAAMQSSSPAWVQTRICDLVALRRHAPQVLMPDDLCVTKRVIGADPAWTRIALTIAAEGSVAQRLDRLLAGELRLSRSFIQALTDKGGLSIARGGRTALKSPLTGEVLLHFDVDRMTAGAGADLAQAFGCPLRET